MLTKPDTCQGCPMYGDGKGYVPDTLVNGRLLVIAQNPGKDEERGQRIAHYEGKQAVYFPCDPQPLIGATGYQLRETYLPLTGESVENVSLANVLKCRWKHSNTLPTGDVLKQAVKHCTDAHLRIPKSVELIVAMGGPAFEFTQPALVKSHRLTQRATSKEGERDKGGPITTWRGFIGPETYCEKPVFAVIHLADLFREPSQRLPARLDWKRVARILQGAWPKEIPHRLVAVDSVAAVSAAFDEAEHAPYIVIDTEYNPDTKFLSLIGIGWRNGQTITGIQLEWVGNESVTSEVRSTFIRRLARLVKTSRVVFQNAKADLPVIQKNLHIGLGAFQAGIDDTMHMHSVLWSELPHKLEFLASIYGQYPKLKHLMHVDPLLYNWGDVLATIDAYEALTKEFNADPLTFNVYTSQSLPLIPITLQRETKGILINQARLAALVLDYDMHMVSFLHMAWAYAGYEINLASSGSNGQLATHLRVYDGVDLDSVDEDTISTERDKYLPFEREYEEKQGLSVEYITRRIENGAQPLLELRAAYIYYAQALNQDLLPLRGKERVYPSARHDAQASGRWSWTKPAMGKVPNDFLPLYVPDEGHIILAADYDAQEPRIFMAESKSTFLKQAFDEGLDIHTGLVCDTFGWPHPVDKQNPHTSAVDEAWRNNVGWVGKEDKRRTIAKNVRFERYYMGTGLQAVKKGVKLGLPPDAMKKASLLVIQQDPNVADFHRAVKKLAKTKHGRSWAGRLRVCMGTGDKVERELCNHKMQAGGVDILNLGIIEVCQTYPFVSLFYTRHDAFYYEIPLAKFTPELANDIRRISEQPRVINGVAVPFPASWKTIDVNGNIEKYTF